MGKTDANTGFCIMSAVGGLGGGEQRGWGSSDIEKQGDRVSEGTGERICEGRNMSGEDGIGS